MIRTLSGREQVLNKRVARLNGQRKRGGGGVVRSLWRDEVGRAQIPRDFVSCAKN